MRSKQKALVVVDVSNIYYCIKHRFPGKKLDYSKYLDNIKKISSIEKAIAFGVELDGQANDFKNALKSYGFELQYKEPKIFPRSRKADWDVGIAIGIVENLTNIDLVVLGSADSDMVPVVEYVQKQDKQCLVYACKISSDLIKIANAYQEISNDELQ